VVVASVRILVAIVHILVAIVHILVAIVHILVAIVHILVAIVHILVAIVHILVAISDVEGRDILIQWEMHSQVTAARRLGGKVGSVVLARDGILGEGRPQAPAHPPYP
jgi:hypothetical protein